MPKADPAADFLAFLDARAGRGRFAVLMRELRGQAFEDAFRTAYGTGVGAAEGQWLRWVNRHLAWVPSPPRSLTERIWSSLPWSSQRSAISFQSSAGSDS